MLTIAGIPVEVQRKRIKNLHLYVKPPDGRVLVTAPRHMSDEAIARFVQAKAQWLLSHVARYKNRPVPAPPQYETGETLLVWGRQYRLLVQPGNRASLRLCANPAAPPSPLEPPTPGDTPTPLEPPAPVDIPNPQHTPTPGDTHNPQDTHTPPERPAPVGNLTPQKASAPGDTPNPQNTHTPGDTSAPQDRHAPGALCGVAVLTARPGATPAQREKAVREWYRARLTEEITRRLPRWEAATGLHAAAFQTKAMTTRWGTCNTKTAKLWFALSLAQKPPECLDYIILHELLHLKERGHNKAFYGLLDSYMPEWRTVKTRLNIT